MATTFTTPKTWATGDVLTAADMNSYVRDNTSWLGTDKPVARCYNSAAIAVVTATDTALTFDTERYDNQNLHSTVTNTSRMTIPAGMGGKYLFTGHIEWASSTAGVSRRIGVRLNGATSVAVHAQNAIPSTGAFQLSIATVYAMAATDYMDLMARQDSGGNLNIQAGLNYSPEFTATWLST